MTYGMICKALRVPLPSLNRWRVRTPKQIAIVQRPGPKKVEPSDPSALDTEIRLLDHSGKSRTAGISREPIGANGHRIGLQDRDGILAPVQGVYQRSHQPKVSPNFSPFFSSRIGSTNTFSTYADRRFYLKAFVGKSLGMKIRNLGSSCIRGKSRSGSYLLFDLPSRNLTIG